MLRGSPVKTNMPFASNNPPQKRSSWNGGEKPNIIVRKIAAAIKSSVPRSFSIIINLMKIRS